MLWMSLESGDEATLNRVEAELTSKEIHIFNELLSEASLEPIVQCGARRFHAMLIAIPVIFKGNPSDIPESIQTCEYLTKEMARHQRGGFTRGLTIGPELYSYSEVTSIPRYQLYRYAVESVKAVWEPLQASAVECANEDQDPYTLPFEDGSVQALRFLLATTFSYEKSPYQYPQQKIELLKQILEFDIRNSPLSNTEVIVGKPDRADLAILRAIPTYYQITVDSMIDDVGGGEARMTINANTGDALFSINNKDTKTFTGLPIILPAITTDITNEVIEQVSEVCNKHQVWMDIHFDGEDPGKLH